MNKEEIRELLKAKIEANIFEDVVVPYDEEVKVMSYKFDGSKYITAGVKEEIPMEVQILMWQLIENLKEKCNFELDYLQVFNLESKGLEFEKWTVKLKHSQEQPDYSEEYIIESDVELNYKIYVIDDIDHITMLLAEEY